MVTVTKLLPEELILIAVISITSVSNAPTISHSGRCLAKPPASAGYF